MSAHHQRSKSLRSLSSLPSAMRGYVLIGSLAAMAVLSTLGYVVVQDRMHESRQDAAELAGTMGAQFKQALRALIAREGTGLPTGTFTGVNWLKDSGSCAGATGSARYLPCEFPAQLPLGLSYRTVVTSAAGVVTATVTFGTPSVGGNTHPTLAGRVVSAINGTSADYSTPATQTYYAATNNVTTGAISMVVTNSQENLEFVKVDGSSTISGNHDWNNFSISNLRNLGVNGTVTATAVNASTVTTSTLAATSGSVSTLTATNASVSGTLNATRARSSRTPTSSSDLANKAYVDSVAGGGTKIQTGTVGFGGYIAPISTFTRGQCALSLHGQPAEQDGAYKRSRHYGHWYQFSGAGWRVYAGYRAIRNGQIANVTNAQIQYQLVCAK